MRERFAYDKQAYQENIRMHRRMEHLKDHTSSSFLKVVLQARDNIEATSRMNTDDIDRNKILRDLEEHTQRENYIGTLKELDEKTPRKKNKRDTKFITAFKSPFLDGILDNRPQSPQNFAQIKSTTMLSTDGE